MSILRMPGMVSAIVNGKSPLDVIDHELMAEKASTLGRAGDKVERTLGALRAYAGEPEARGPLVDAAARAVYGYFIQRELCGMRRHQDVINEYQIPAEVLSRLGAG